MIQHGIEFLSGLIWGPVTVTIILLIGIMFTVQNRFIQFRYIRLWLHRTVGQLMHRSEHTQTGITRVQALTTALAGTMGTGNIVGVATALSLGGPGAVFWMWISAFVGMMIKYAEVVLAVRYRVRNRSGKWIGGAMEVMEHGLHRPKMAMIFAVCCVLASFGMGNMAQANAIAQSLADAFRVPAPVTGLLCAGFLGGIIFGGIKRIAQVTEKLIPLLSLFYAIGGIAVVLFHLDRFLPSLGSILAGAFSGRSATGGAVGMGIALAMRHGVSNGIFSNEAGLGSSGMLYAEPEDAQPVAQGFWGIFEVFADTIVVCSITALAILCGGVPLDSKTGASLVIAAFETVFGSTGGIFVALSIALFAFASMMGWAYYGERSFVKIAGGNVNGYRLLFVVAAYIGCVLQLRMVWGLSEIFNGLMAVPNLIALVLLAPIVREETEKWFNAYALPPHGSIFSHTKGDG